MGAPPELPPLLPVSPPGLIGGAPWTGPSTGSSTGLGVGHFFLPPHFCLCACPSFYPCLSSFFPSFCVCACPLPFPFGCLGRLPCARSCFPCACLRSFPEAGALRVSTRDDLKRGIQHRFSDRIRPR